MITFDALDDVAEELRDADLRASTDPADLSPPCILVEPDAIDPQYLNGYTHRARLLLVVPNNGQQRALEALSTLLGQVIAVVGLPTEAVLYRSVTLPGSTTGLPGLIFTIERSDTYQETP